MGPEYDNPKPPVAHAAGGLCIELEATRAEIGIPLPGDPETDLEPSIQNGVPGEMGRSHVNPGALVCKDQDYAKA
jgi:hypothetical protein